MIACTKLWETLKERGISQYKLKTILDCSLSDIAEYIKSEESTES